MTFNKMGTLPLPLALHLATHTVIGLFCAFAGEAQSRSAKVAAKSSDVAVDRVLV